MTTTLNINTGITLTTVMTNQFTPQPSGFVALL